MPGVRWFGFTGSICKICYKYAMAINLLHPLSIQSGGIVPGVGGSGCGNICKIFSMTGNGNHSTASIE